MMAETTDPGPGGFEPTRILSPAPSSASPRATVLPHPRQHALRAGSVKEDKIRRFVEERLLHISRRYVKKFGIPEPGDEVVGYKSMGELCKDLQSLIDVLWLSGTPGLQIPYFLNIAHELTTWSTSFPPSPAATFAVLRKLDHCFASLLSGQDVDTKEALPGFENGLRSGMTRTDMVRCKSIVQEMRVVIVEIMSRPDVEVESAAEDSSEDETGSGSPNLDDDDDDDDDWQMDVARVYEDTIVKLGELLGDGGGLGDIEEIQ